MESTVDGSEARRVLEEWAREAGFDLVGVIPSKLLISSPVAGLAVDIATKTSS